MHKIKTTWAGPNPFGLARIEHVKATRDKMIVDAAAHKHGWLKTHGVMRGCWASLYGYCLTSKTLEIVCSKSDVQKLAVTAREWVLRHGFRVRVVQAKQSIDGMSRVFLTGGAV
jgi:hypothetical protein